MAVELVRKKVFRMNGWELLGWFAAVAACIIVAALTFFVVYAVVSAVRGVRGRRAVRSETLYRGRSDER
ncbi:hypothetical protein [Microbacterium sp. No. 7]|uniref:hypothetical protein n=1 Tax=Microbacterium sp. No. 7 TaxID=1714373 RepID=UPI000A683509|nr:hypothetical protein [Microbacterium sp. No. 7]